MIYPLTEKQKEIVDYSETHSYAETQEMFQIGRNQVRYLREKRNRIEREKGAGDSAVPQSSAAFARVECGVKTVEVKIGNTTMSISASDLAEVIRRL